MTIHILGVDFTSAPRRAKPITAAWATLSGHTLTLVAQETADTWPAFERLLHTRAPFIGAFDFPFGLPRELVSQLNWPTRWADLVTHCQHLGRAAFADALNAVRQARPVGQKYLHRATDGPAGSSSPMKLVNPPVALMFLEGTQRLLHAGLHVPGMHTGDPQRIALEGYPGLLARALVKGSYKSDARKNHTPARAAARAQIVSRLQAGDTPLGITLSAPAPLLQAMQEDGSADTLDAVLCAVQAAWAYQRRDAFWGLPTDLDPIEGWIASAPAPR